MASILKRNGPKNSIVWQAQIRKKGYPAQIKTFDRKTDAQKWAKMIEHQMDAGLWKDSSEASQVTLAEALGRYLQTVTPRKRPKTQISEQLSSRYLIQHLGKLSLLQVTPEKVAAYRDKRLNSVSPNSVRIELSLLSNLFNIAIREWSFSGLENPVRLIQKPKTPEGRCPILSEDQINRLLEECKNTNCRLLYPFVLLALHTGARSSELRKLRWAQVNLDDGYITLIGTETKTQKTRTIPLTDAAIDTLRELANNVKSGKVVDIYGAKAGLVFPAKGNIDNPRDMHMTFNKVVKRVQLDDLPGVGKLRIHDLRHLCGTFLVMNGVDLETVRGILGHNNISTTQRYLHVINEHKRKSISKIGHLGLGNSNNIINSTFAGAR